MERQLNTIPVKEVMHYLGCQSGDARLEQQIAQAIQRVLQLARPKLVYQVVTVSGYDNELQIPLHGEDVKRLLQSCHHAIFMAATLGAAVDLETKRLAIKDMGELLVFDAACNAAIEVLADEFQEERRVYYQARKQYLSDRFSCGYGDLSIQIQKAFCDALDTKRTIGLYVNDSYLLMPMKSITALIGIADQPQPKRISGCENCDMKETCQLRRGGQRCG